MTILRKSIAAVFSLSMVSSAAFAEVAAGVATITDVSGKVLVNSGEGFVQATANMVLKASDRVFVGEQSLATVSYQSCAVLLDKPTVVEITADGGCNAATSIQPVADVYDPSAGAPVAAAAGIAPILLLSTAAVVGVTCVVACNKIFGKKKNGGPAPVVSVN